MRRREPRRRDRHLGAPIWYSIDSRGEDLLSAREIVNMVERGSARRWDRCSTMQCGREIAGHTAQIAIGHRRADRWGGRRVRRQADLSATVSEVGEPGRPRFFVGANASILRLCRCDVELRQDLARATVISGPMGEW